MHNFYFLRQLFLKIFCLLLLDLDCEGLLCAALPSVHMSHSQIYARTLALEAEALRQKIDSIQVPTESELSRITFAVQALKTYQMLPGIIHQTINEYADIQFRDKPPKEKKKRSWPSQPEVDPEGHFSKGWEWWLKQKRSGLLSEVQKLPTYTIDQQYFLNLFFHYQNKQNRLMPFVPEALGYVIFKSFTEAEQKILVSRTDKLPELHHACVLGEDTCCRHIIDPVARNEWQHGGFSFMFPRPLGVSDDGDVVCLERALISNYLLVARKKSGERISLGCASYEREFLAGMWCTSGNYFITLGHGPISVQPKDNLMVYVICSIWRWPGYTRIRRAMSPCFTEEARGIAQCITMPCSSTVRSAWYDEKHRAVCVTFPQENRVSTYQVHDEHTLLEENICGDVVPTKKLTYSIRSTIEAYARGGDHRQAVVDAWSFFRTAQAMRAFNVSPQGETVILSNDGSFSYLGDTLISEPFRRCSGIIQPSWPVVWSNNSQYALVPFQKTLKPVRIEWGLMKLTLEQEKKERTTQAKPVQLQAHGDAECCDVM